MEVICPKCNKSIATNYLNKSKGISYCNYCRDYFMLDNHLRRDPYYIRREEKFTKIPKPTKTKIEIKETPQEVTINFPDRFSLIIRLFLMIFLTAIIYAIYLNISNSETLNVEFYLKIGILIILGILLFLAIVLKGPKTILTIRNDIIRLNRKRYALPSYFRNRKTDDLDTIDVYFDSDNESGGDSGRCSKVS